MRGLLFFMTIYLHHLSIGASRSDDIMAISEVVSESRQAQFEQPFASAFVHLARFISCVANKCSNSEEQDTKEWKDLLSNLGQKMDQMNGKFDERCDGLEDESDFETNFIVPASAQFDFLRGVIKYQTRESIDLFKNHYEKHDPAHAIVKISKRLSHQNTTNPIVGAMTADELRTKKTLEKWTTCVNNTLTTMHMSYLFFEGLDGRNVSESNGEFEKFKAARDILSHFISTYKTDYWPHVVERVIKETVHHGKYKHNLAKARTIKGELEQIATNVMVYRSDMAPEYSNSLRKDLIVDTDWFARQYSKLAVKNVTDLVQKEIPYAGFVGLIKSDKHVAVRSIDDSDDVDWFVKSKFDCKSTGGIADLFVAL